MTPLGILAAGLAELREQAGADDAVPAWLRERLASLTQLAGGLDPYVAAVSSPEPAYLQRLADRTRSHDWQSAAGRAALGLEQEMLSGHVEGRLLALLVRAVGARHVLEIGTFTGYATLAMAAAVATQPDGGRVVTCELDPEVAALAADGFARSPHAAGIDLRVGPARVTLAALADEGACFDLVFLDADKAGYRDYVEDLLQLGLLAPHGLLCVDNTLMQGQPWTDGPGGNGAAVAAFNEWLARDERMEQVLVPLRDGVTLAMRRASGAA